MFIRVLKIAVMQQLYREKEQNAVLMDVWDLDLVLVNVSLMPFIL